MLLAVAGVAMVLMTECAQGARVGPATQPSQDWCRASDEVTRCVGTPLPLHNPEVLCPIEVCKPSYVKAEPCPLEGPKATARCEVQQVTTPFWDCTNDAMYRRTNVPFGCEESDDEECYEITTCTCERRTTERAKLVFKEEKAPKCNTGVNSRRGWLNIKETSQNRDMNRRNASRFGVRNYTQYAWMKYLQPWTI